MNYYTFEARLAFARAIITELRKHASADGRWFINTTSPIKVVEDFTKYNVTFVGNDEEEQEFTLMVGDIHSRTTLSVDLATFDAQHEVVLVLECITSPEDVAAQYYEWVQDSK